MKLSFWSDEDRWFVPRSLGLGYSLNLKYIAKRLGWIRPSAGPGKPRDEARADAPRIETESREDRLRNQIEKSRFEANR
jgi:hypothetical protein